MKAGDTVKLQTGGPRLFVLTVGVMGANVCWFDKRHKYHTVTIPERALVVVPSKKEEPYDWSKVA